MPKLASGKTLSEISEILGISVTTLKDELKHYGILGMRWGVITKPRHGSKKSEDFMEKQRLLKKNKNSLTNSELKKLNERLQLETQLSKLNKSKIQKGASILKGLVEAGRLSKDLYSLYKTYNVPVRKYISIG